MCDSCGCEHKTEQPIEATSNKKGLFDLLDRKQAFLLGIVAGFLVLCTLGFFIMLGVSLSGGISFGSGGVKAPKKFSECLTGNKMKDKVSADLAIGESLGVQGTPATFINGYLISGALPYTMVKQVLDAVIAGNKPEFDFMKDDSGKIPNPVTMPDLPEVSWKGNPNAAITVVEFADFECPYCAKYYPTVKQMLQDYGDKIRYTYRHYPLSFHQYAQKAAEAYECAKAQGKGWEMYDKLFTISDSGKLSNDAINQAAKEIKLK
jgi:protein-disulfide isomerase